MGFLKDLMTKVTKEDEGLFHIFKRIYETKPRHYMIRNCTKGFMVLAKRSNIPCDVTEINKTVETKGYGRTDIECTSEALAETLSEMIKGRY